MKILRQDESPLPPPRSAAELQEESHLPHLLRSAVEASADD